MTGQRRGYAVRADRAVAAAISTIPLIVAALALVVLLLATGTDPGQAARVLLESSVGSTAALSLTAVKMTPILIAGLGVALASRAGLWNLGAEGQLVVGGVTGTAVALYVLPPGPWWMTSPFLLACGFAGGALWALLPALLRAYRGSSEVVTTLMCNFVAIGLLGLLLDGPMGVPDASYPQSHPVPQSERLPVLIPGTRLHLGIVIAALCLLVFAAVEKHSVFGFELRAVASAEVARTCGIPVSRRLLQAMLISGGVAGVAGIVEILGGYGSLVPGFAATYGFDAVAVALLARGRVAGTVIGAFVFGALRAGTPALKLQLQAPASVVTITQSIAIVALVAVIAGNALWRTRRKSSARKQDVRPAMEVVA